MKPNRTNSRPACRTPPQDIPDIHPNVADIYRRRIERLTEALHHPDDAREAAEALREVIDRIVLNPGAKRGDLYVTLHGNFGTILDWIDRSDRNGERTKDDPYLSRMSVSVKGRA